MAVFLSQSEEDTLRFAAEYAKTLQSGDTVLLDGEMGAGKTVIAKGIAKGLGIECEVTSPTYAYINDYEGRLFHFDCYRIASEAQAESLGFADYFDLGGICLVEWSEYIKGLLPAGCKRISVRKTKDGSREIAY